MPQGYYSAEEIAKMYTMSKKTVCKLARENNIPKINYKGFAYYERLSVTTFFSKYKFQDDVKAWLSGQEIEEIYQMTPNARRSLQAVMISRPKLCTEKLIIPKTTLTW